MSSETHGHWIPILVVSYDMHELQWNFILENIVLPDRQKSGIIKILFSRCYLQVSFAQILENILEKYISLQWSCSK